MRLAAFVDHREPDGTVGGEPDEIGIKPVVLGGDPNFLRVPVTRGQQQEPHEPDRKRRKAGTRPVRSRRDHQVACSDVFPLGLNRADLGNGWDQGTGRSPHRLGSRFYARIRGDVRHSRSLGSLPASA